MRLWHAGDIPTVAYLLQTGEVDVVLAGDGEDDDGMEAYDRDNPVCTTATLLRLGADKSGRGRVVRGRRWGGAATRGGVRGRCVPHRAPDQGGAPARRVC